MGRGDVGVLGSKTWSSRGAVVEVGVVWRVEVRPHRSNFTRELPWFVDLSSFWFLVSPLASLGILVLTGVTAQVLSGTDSPRLLPRCLSGAGPRARGTMMSLFRFNMVNSSNSF